MSMVYWLPDACRVHTGEGIEWLPRFGLNKHKPLMSSRGNESTLLIAEHGLYVLLSLIGFMVLGGRAGNGPLPCQCFSLNMNEPFAGFEGTG